MRRLHLYPAILIISFMSIAGCSSAYKAKPMPFKMPSAYANLQSIGKAEVAAKAFYDATEAKDAFGFDIRRAGLLPVQLVFDNKGTHPLQVVEQQTFLEDQQGNLWPILSKRIAYQRASKYTKTLNTIQKGAYHGLLGAAAGSIIGAAVGIVSGSNVAEAIGQGAAVGAASGAILGGTAGFTSETARRAIINDLRKKSLKNSIVKPLDLAHGFLFFPGEAATPANLRLRLLERDSGKSYLAFFRLN